MTAVIIALLVAVIAGLVSGIVTAQLGASTLAAVGTGGGAFVAIAGLGLVIVAYLLPPAQTKEAASLAPPPQSQDAAAFS
ncbi:hypothetical protein ACIQNV_39390 [Streptomyces hydrogenans]|uniref:hypothetical protein n=1 Tax=Streptomyces hydrogenans TaxID=1873719 RepID=UPI0038301D4F